MKPAPPPHARLPPPCRGEAEVLAACAPPRRSGSTGRRVVAMARPWVQAVRDKPAPFWAMESLLQEYPISSREGLALMRLAEALLRVPDAETAIALTADQLGRADFAPADGGRHSHRLIASLSASAISLSKRFLPRCRCRRAGLFRRLGAQTVVAATRARDPAARPPVRARPLDRGGAWRSRERAQGQHAACASATTCSARARAPSADAERYLQSLPGRDPLPSRAARDPAAGPEANDGISIKLSALLRATRSAARARLRRAGAAGLAAVELAARANLNLTIDAEESRPAGAFARRASRRWPRAWRRAAAVARLRPGACRPTRRARWSWSSMSRRIGREHGLRLMVRLVKGAYWDAEIKRAQELGLAAYPVFTHKHHTDSALPGLRRARCWPRRRDLPAVRDPQRRHDRGDPADGRGQRRRLRDCSGCTAWARACTAR